jgi:hypothetical protein
MVTALAVAIPLMVVGAIDVLAMRYGRDSRPGFDERHPLA